MKIMLVAVNAKYVHTNIAVRYISRYCNMDFCEFTVNEPMNNVLQKLYAMDCDAYGFSCYIWNIDYVLKLCQSLKKLRPERKIFLGGPEVSFNGEELLEKQPFLDLIISGEGEIAVRKIKESFPDERKVIYGEKINMDDLPFPYTNDDLENCRKGEKLVYYETTRGCPFNCVYCLSSADRGVRFLPIDRVKNEIKMMVDAGVMTVKFVDRTFNADKNRAMEIWKYCMDLKGDTCFHFEIGADLLDDDAIDMLREVPKGKFQFEIGVQTTNKEALGLISRSMDLEKLKKNVSRLQSETNIMLHLDLIAGLPNEDMHSFKKSFNDVYALSPHVLQLGFLKLLKGTPLFENADALGISFCDFAPYEVFSTKEISFAELTIIKKVEDVLERYFNSGRFINCLPSAVEYFKSPFDFYLELSKYWDELGLVGQGVKRISLYAHLHDFLKPRLSPDAMNSVMKLMKTDFECWHSKGVGVPEWYKEY